MRLQDIKTGATRRFAYPTLLATSACIGSVIGTPGALAQTAPSDPTPPDQKPKTEDIKVTGLRSLLNDKLPGSVQDTPQTIDVIDQEVMKQQGVTRLQDALKNVPGITLNAGEGAARGDTVNLRGFTAFNDFFMDGIRDAGVYDRDSFDTEAVEVLKGPSAILFGRGSTGGVINQVSKSPSLTPLQTGTLSLGTNDSFRATADVDAALDPTSAIRLNAMDEHSEVTDRDDVVNRRYGVAPSFAWGLGQADSVVVSYLHQEEDNTPDSGVPFVNGRPAPVPRNGDYGLTSNRAKTDVDIATLRYKHEFTADLWITDTLRYADDWYDYHIAMPNFGNEIITPATPLNKILVGRDYPASSGIQTNLTNQTDLTARFATGLLSHVLKLGFEVDRETYDLQRFNNPFNKNNAWVPETLLVAPNPNGSAPAQPVTSKQKTEALALAGYAIDTISLGTQFDLLAGLRVDRFGATNNQFAPTTFVTTHLDRTDYATSPKAALVYKPSDDQRYYLSYGTSFDPSAEALSLSAKTADLAPVKAHSYEAGSKLDWLDGQLATSGAIFRTEVDNAQTNDPDNPSVLVLSGDQRVTGFELGVNGHLTAQWEVTAGYTYLDAKTIASGTANTVGKFLTNTARNAVNLWTEYYLSDKWEVGTGGNWLGHRFADAANTTVIPSYVVWNAMAAYTVNDRVTVQLNGFNLMDKTYYDNAYYTSASENHVIPGPGRTFILTTSVNF